MKLAVRRRLRRVVAEQVVRARVTHHLLEASRKIVSIDNRAAVGVLGQATQRVHRRVEVLAAHLRVDVVGNVEFRVGEAARIERVNRDVVSVRGGVDLLQIRLQVHACEKRGSRLVWIVEPGHGIAVIRIAVAGSPGDRIPHLRRQHVAEAFADEDQRLAALFQRAQVRDEPLDG